MPATLDPEQVKKEFWDICQSQAPQAGEEELGAYDSQRYRAIKCLLSLHDNGFEVAQTRILFGENPEGDQEHFGELFLFVPGLIVFRPIALPDLFAVLERLPTGVQNKELYHSTSIHGKSLFYGWPGDTRGFEIVFLEPEAFTDELGAHFVLKYRPGHHKQEQAYEIPSQQATLLFRWFENNL